MSTRDIVVSRQTTHAQAHMCLMRVNVMCEPGGGCDPDGPCHCDHLERRGRDSVRARHVLYCTAQRACCSIHYLETRLSQLSGTFRLVSTCSSAPRPLAAPHSAPCSHTHTRTQVCGLQAVPSPEAVHEPVKGGECMPVGQVARRSSCKQYTGQYRAPRLLSELGGPTGLAHRQAYAPGKARSCPCKASFGHVCTAACA